MLSNVILATDFSKYSEFVLKTLLNLEGIEKLTIVRVIKDRDADIENEKEASEEKLREIVKLFEDRGVKARYVIPVGDPSTEIVRVAREIDASLIAMGSRGRGLLAKLLGSVAEGVIKKIEDIPVLVIRKETKNVFDRVLFAYCPLKFSDSVLEILKSIPCKELILLYVVKPILPPEASSKIMKQKVIEAEDILSKVKSELEGSMKVETAIRIGHPCEEIIRCAKEFKATCIALGSRPKRPILGSTTSYILSHSEIPVLVCKGIFEC